MYLYGASGHAKVIIDILEASGEKIDGLVDDNLEVEQLQGYPVLHGSKGMSPFIVSIGVNAVRKKVAEKLKGVEFGKAIHPSAIVSPSASIREGTVVMQGAVIQADVRIGKHCIINTGASVDHECIISDYAHISPHSTLCGNVQIGEGSWIGAGTTVIPGVKMTKDIPDGVLAVGNRCEIIKSLDIKVLIKIKQGGVKSNLFVYWLHKEGKQDYVA